MFIMRMIPDVSKTMILCSLFGYLWWFWYLFLIFYWPEQSYSSKIWVFARKSVILGIWYISHDMISQRSRFGNKVHRKMWSCLPQVHVKLSRHQLLARMWSGNSNLYKWYSHIIFLISHFTHSSLSMSVGLPEWMFWLSKSYLLLRCLIKGFQA